MGKIGTTIISNHKTIRIIILETSIGHKPDLTNIPW